MNPAFSVLFFTVLSGAGLGALALIALLDLALAAGVADSPVLPRVIALAATIAWLLVAAGLCSSTLHLANPKNAWRAWSRWRTSWLSREAVVSLALMPVAAIYVACWWWDVPTALRVVLAALLLVLAWGTLLCTAMIYASLKPIRQWHTRRVPLNFFLLGHASGALVVVAVLRGHGLAATSWTLLALLLLIVAAIGKAEYWRFVRSGERAVTLEQAIGVAHGVRPPPAPGAAPSIMAARLFDAGHSGGTFLTREFVNHVAAQRRIWVLALVWGFAFALPTIWLVVGLARWEGALLASLACMVGLLAERWLFFADARHTVRLYHGERTT